MQNDIEFFDKPGNGPGSLCSNLENDCSALNMFITTVLASVMNQVGCILFALVLAFVASWRMSLVTIVAVPFMALGTYIEYAMQQRNQKQLEKNKGSDFIQENITNIKTVRAINTLQETLEKFQENLEKKKIIYSRLILSSFSFGFGQSMQFFTLAYMFYMAAIIRDKYDEDFSSVFKSLFTLYIASFGYGLMCQGTKDAVAVDNAVINIYEFCDRKDIVLNSKDAINLNDFKGNIEFKNVYFKYPTRENYIFEGLSFKIKAGQKVAFVGQSGKGKSTIIQLLLRYYDIESGEILLDGVDIKIIDISNLRSMFGLVSQEPYLFNNTLSYNIKYNKYDATLDDIKKAALISNASKFIEKDEAFAGDQYQTDKSDAVGYDREVGLRGCKLSGGQKQRVAIARAVLRNPKVYLFDEATSALDSNSEKIVQEALNVVSKDKACISIAHRISTIHDSDVIFVLADKKVKEEGTYEQLMNLKGEFYEIATGV